MPQEGNWLSWAWIAAESEALRPTAWAGVLLLALLERLLCQGSSLIARRLHQRSRDLQKMSRSTFAPGSASPIVSLPLIADFCNKIC
jgi:hypothetical protein